FLIHLTPLTVNETVEMPELTDGWFSTPTKCRVPKKIPLGIPAPEPEGLPEKPNPEQVFPLDIFQHTERFKRAAVAGGGVEVPVEHFERLFRVAWFCHPWTIPEIRVQLPKSAPFPDSGEHMEKVVMRQSGDIIGIQVESTNRQSGSIRQVAAIASR